MEISELLSLTPEQRAGRKKDHDIKKALEQQGRDYEREIMETRAHKALVLLRAHIEDTNTLDEPTKIACCGIVFEQCKASFFFFCKHVLDMDLLSVITHKKWADNHQHAILKNLKRVMRLKSRGTYKCLKKGTPLVPFGIDEKYNILPAALLNQGDFIEDGIKVTLASGRSQICTKDHPFKTIGGWESAKEGLRVAVVRTMPSPYIPVCEAEEYMMGLLVGDGCLKRSTPILSCADQSILKVLEGYGFNLNKTDQIRYDYRVLKFYKETRESGLEGTNSWTKFIPSKYEGSPFFLRGLFDADGSVSKRDPSIIFVTVSERLADDVLRNLHYFGIVGRKSYYEYPATLKSPEHKAYRITIYNGFMREFRDKIGFACEQKREKLDNWIKINDSGRDRNENVDTIPNEWKKMLSLKERRSIFYNLSERIDNKYSHSRKKVNICGEFLKRKDIIELADSNIFWDKIVKIENVGPVEFSAIGSSIENYMTPDGIIHHNTSIYGIGAILWIWGCVSPQVRIFYTSSNALLLQEVYDKMNQYVGSNKGETLYSLIFGITKDDNAKNTADVMNIKGRSGKGFSFVLRTAGGSTNGIHPNVIIVDDPCDNNDRESEATRSSKERWFDSLVPLLVPFKDERTGIDFETIFYISTRWHMKDLTNYILERDKTLPEKQKWDIEIEAVCTENGKSNYPDFISDEKIAEIRASMSDAFFACQYLNNPISEATQIFNMKKLTFVRPEQVNIKNGQICCFFDPSLGKTSSDFPMTQWVHFDNGIMTVIDAIDTKVELSLIVHQIAAKNAHYGCRFLKFENNGITLIEQSLKDAHNRLGWRMQYAPIHHSSNKHERILSIQPDLYSGAVQFMSDYMTRYPELMNQIVFYPVWGFDDSCDCLEMAISHFKQKHFKFVRYEACL